MTRKIATAVCVAGVFAGALTGAGQAAAVPLELGSVSVPLPDLPPMYVGTPFGLPVTSLPPLPYPFSWVGPAPVDPFGGRTVVLDCGDRPQKLPDSIVVACGDGNLQFRGAHWDSWTDDSATGTAVKTYSDCIPSCASGTPHHDPVSITLHDVRSIRVLPVFTHMTVRDSGRTYEQGISGFQYH